MHFVAAFRGASIEYNKAEICISILNVSPHVFIKITGVQPRNLIGSITCYAL
jgi:hypothetical protein